MFAATLIVFRESLEAALFVGIVAAATRQLVGRAAGSAPAWPSACWARCCWR